MRIEGNNRFNNALTDGFENTPEPYHCLAEKCMMWRENYSVHLKAHAGEAPAAHGYCGLAGHVEYNLGY